MKRTLLVLVLLLPLGGCETLVANAVADYMKVHAAGMQLFDDVVDARRKARESCRKIIEAMVDDAIDDGEYEKALKLERRYYPRLWALKAVKSAVDEDPTLLLDSAPGCEDREATGLSTG